MILNTHPTKRLNKKNLEKEENNGKKGHGRMPNLLVRKEIVYPLVNVAQLYWIETIAAHLSIFTPTLFNLQMSWPFFPLDSVALSDAVIFPHSGHSHSFRSIFSHAKHKRWENVTIQKIPWKKVLQRRYCFSLDWSSWTDSNSNERINNWKKRTEVEMD